MPLFLHGWRRKAGGLALLLALALMVAWIRSFLVEDLVLRGTHSDTYFISRDGARHWDRITYISGIPINREPNLRWEVRRLPCPGAVTSLRFLKDALWQRSGLGFRVAVAEYPDSGGTPCRRGKWTVPYWAVTLPPALLSAYLILQKPRKPQAH